MKLSVCNLGENAWFNYKSDILFGLFYSLQAAGHDVTLDHNRPTADRLNILVGTDQVPLDPQLTELFADSRPSQRFDYCVFETEIFCGRTLNLRQGFEIDLYLDILRRAQFVFTPFLHNTHAYHEVGIEARYLRWGHNAGVRIYEQRLSTFRFEACFVGTIKGLRERKLAEMKRSMGERLIAIDVTLPFQFREYGEVNAASILSIDYACPGYPVNPFRIQRALSNGKLVFHDHDNDADGYTDGCIRVRFDRHEISALLRDHMPASPVAAGSSSGKFQSRLQEIFAN